MKTLQELRQEEVTLRISTWKTGDVPEITEMKMAPPVPPKATQNQGFKKELSDKLFSRKSKKPVRPITLTSEDGSDEGEQTKRDSAAGKSKNEPPYDKLPYSNKPPGQVEATEEVSDLEPPEEVVPDISRERLPTYPFKQRPLPKPNSFDEDWKDPG